MNDNDSIRDRQNGSGDEELEESTVGGADTREDTPAADDNTVEDSHRDTAASPRDNEPAPAEEAGAHATPDDESRDADESQSPDVGPADAVPPNDTAPSPAPDHGHGHDERDATSEAHPAHDGETEDRGKSQVVLKAGTDEESLHALELCREKVKELRLRMHPLAARYDDDRHITIFFRADDKVDFRKLVRELSRLLHARIEMRQLGPREQGKLCGLVGKCGYPLCCRTFLGQFAQSSIKMAKTQDLALNPMKISGVCGRLLCCLNYEQEMYADVKSRMPKMNKFVDTEFGRGRVVALNVLRQTVTVQFETNTKELSLEQVNVSEASSPHAAPEDTSATPNESRNSDTEHDSRNPGEQPEH